MKKVTLGPSSSRVDKDELRKKVLSLGSAMAMLMHDVIARDIV